MLNRKLQVTFLFAFVLGVSSCGGGANVLDMQSSFSTASQSASLEQVQRNIITACETTGWRPSTGEAGHIIAYRRHVGRVAKVDITYTSSSFNIRYLDSDNMGYDGKTISPVYEQWVGNLQDEIKRRLSEL